MGLRHKVWGRRAAEGLEICDDEDGGQWTWTTLLQMRIQGSGWQMPAEDWSISGVGPLWSCPFELRSATGSIHSAVLLQRCPKVFWDWGRPCAGVVVVDLGRGAGRDRPPVLSGADEVLEVEA